MAITSGICISFKKEILLGEHDLDTDALKLALYTSAASLSDGTTAYTTSQEVVGTGYSAGGVTLTGVDVTVDSSVAVVSITDAVVTAATITARGALIYNSTNANKAVAVFDFGADKSSSNGDFTIQFPAAAAATAIIRIKSS
jgi:anaerobic selenocysteine-containing dehydrogenase